MAAPARRQAVFCEVDRDPESAALFGAPRHRRPAGIAARRWAAARIAGLAPRVSPGGGFMA